MVKRKPRVDDGFHFAYDLEVRMWKRSGGGTGLAILDQLQRRVCVATGEADGDYPADGDKFNTSRLTGMNRLT
jgi:hypothetical protein